MISSRVEPAPMAEQETSTPEPNSDHSDHHAGCKECNRCNSLVRPLEDKVPTCSTHVIALVLFLIGLPFLIFVPYCFNCGGKIAHRCPRCGNYLSEHS